MSPLINSQLSHGWQMQQTLTINVWKHLNSTNMERNFLKINKLVHHL